MQIKSQGLEPLQACQNIIARNITSTHLLIAKGSSVKNGKIEECKNLSNNASLLGSLPEIPDLKDVPFLTFCYERSAESAVSNILNGFGQVCRIAPVQVNFITIMILKHI